MPCSRCGAKYREDPSCGKIEHLSLPSREVDPVSNAPDHEYNPLGLTTLQLIKRMLEAPLDCKVYVETGPREPDDEGEVIGEITEIQWGRDGHVYVRIDRNIDQIREEK